MSGQNGKRRIGMLILYNSDCILMQGIMTNDNARWNMGAKYQRRNVDVWGICNMQECFRASDPGKGKSRREQGSLFDEPDEPSRSSLSGTSWSPGFPGTVAA